VIKAVAEVYEEPKLRTFKSPRKFSQLHTVLPDKNTFLSSLSHNFGKHIAFDLNSVKFPNRDVFRQLLTSKVVSNTFTSKPQTVLYNMIKRLLPEHTVYMNYRLPERSTIKGYIEYDIFIPSLALALEYQGEIHYISTNYFGSSQSIKNHDRQKQIISHAIGITVVPIPYWWDLQQNSLQATLSGVRPDVFSVPLDSNPIPFRKELETDNLEKSTLHFFNESKLWI